MQNFDYLPFLPPELRLIPWRAHPLDGKLLLFHRETGLNLLLEGEETAHLTRVAPRTLLIAITNACNLTCHFCYRDLENRSLWRYDTLMQFCHEANTWGVLEVAFGGGEPMLFPQWAEFINELYATTGLCANFTTNGTLLTGDFLQQIAGKYGQIRVSLYEDNHWHETVKLLVEKQARFGVNWLITPAELPGIEEKFAELLSLGVRDFLLLSYKGDDQSLHFRREHYRQFADFVNQAHQKLGSRVTLKLDICFGNLLPNVPRLFAADDCGAGDEFLSITSDKHVKACSFQHTHTGIAFDTMSDLQHLWEQRRSMHQIAMTGGCARLPNRGLTVAGIPDAFIPLAAIEHSYDNSCKHD